jgi:organic radical activating enzyme
MSFLKDLTIEVTRKCNFTCGHCLRGDAQNLDFDIKHLKNFLSTTDVTEIETISFTGGEPFLNPKGMIEIIQLLKKKKISIRGYTIVTNGSIFNLEALGVIANLHELCSENYGSKIIVSNSKWHKEDKNRIAFISWDEILLKHKNKFQALNYSANLTDVRMELEDGNYHIIINEGRGKNIAESNHNHTHDIFTFYGMTYINADGKVIESNCNMSYESQESFTKDDAA